MCVLDVCVRVRVRACVPVCIGVNTGEVIEHIILRMTRILQLLSTASSSGAAVFLLARRPRMRAALSVSTYVYLCACVCAWQLHSIHTFICASHMGQITTHVKTASRSPSCILVCGCGSLSLCVCVLPVRAGVRLSASRVPASLFLSRTSELGMRRSS